MIGGWFAAEFNVVVARASERFRPIGRAWLWFWNSTGHWALGTRKKALGTRHWERALGGVGFGLGEVGFLSCSRLIAGRV